MRNHYTLAGIVGAAVLAGVLTGCASTPPAPAAPTPAPTYATAAPLVSSSGGYTGSDYYTSGDSTTDSVFLSVVNTRPGLVVYPNATLVAAARSVCSQREAGTSTQSIVLAAENSLSAYDSGYLIGASEKAYCPAYYDW